MKVKEWMYQQDSTWCIQNMNYPELFWSNDWGWVEEGFTLFTEKERKELNLPLEGEWILFNSL